MYFLDGDRTYIKPEKACGTINEQINSCIGQLKQLNSGKQIFKLNFFIDSESDKAYNALKTEIEEKVELELQSDIITTLIAQPPLTCKIIVEAFYFDTSFWENKVIEVNGSRAVRFKKDKTEFLIGTVQADSKISYEADSKQAFKKLSSLLSLSGFPVNSIVRQWNYLEDIIGFEGDKQNYQEFNNVRSLFYKDYFAKTGFPAATGIGTNRGGVIIEFVALKSNRARSLPVDNPEQIAAHDYSEEVLVGKECVVKTTPKFERARYLELHGKKMIFISGTASIIGEHTIGINDPGKQTEVTLDNIRRLYSEQILANLSNQKLEAKYGHARVYVKNRKDFAAIKRTFKAQFPKLSVVYIVADICRPELLVEIEGKVILE